MAGNLRVTQEYVSVLGRSAGTLRATQAYVAVLGRSAGNLRTTQVYVSVLGPSFQASEYEVSATSTIVLTQQARSPSISVEAENTLGVSQTLVYGGPINVSAETVVPLAQTAVSSIKFVSAASTLALTSTGRSNIMFKSAGNPLFFSQLAEVTSNQVFPTSTLNLTQQASVPTYYRTPSSALILSQEAVGSGPVARAASSAMSMSATAFLSEVTYRPEAENEIALTHQADFASIKAGPTASTLELSQEATGFTLAVTASNQLVFSQIVDSQVKFRAASSNLPLSQAATVEYVPSIGVEVSHTLTLTQLAVAEQISTAGNTLELTQAANFVRTLLLSASNVINLTQAFTYESAGLSTKKYSPQTGGNSPVDIRKPTLERQEDVEFFYPPLGPKTYSLRLDTPEFGNLDRNAYSRINQESRGGSLTIFSDPKWPKTRTLLLSFVGVKFDDVDAFKTFLAGTLGKEVGFRDWENRRWKGIIANPETGFIQNRKSGKDFSIEIQADINDVANEFSVLALTQTAVAEVN